MNRAITLLAAFAAVSAYAACPSAAPGSMAIVTTPNCSEFSACPNGPVVFTIQPFPTGGFPPAPYDPGYTIQPCDTITWSFGDGANQIVSGLDHVTHDYPNPGNYVIAATVTNSLGSATVHYRTAAVIATAPSRLSFVTGPVKTPMANGRNAVCIACVELSEGSGGGTITVQRTLDLSRTVSAEATLNVRGTSVRVPLTFGPGEVQKSFFVPVADDHVYSGVSYSSLTFANPTGGTLTYENVPYQPTVVVADDDPIPTLSIEPAFIVTEGDAGLTPIAVPVHLSAPMGVDVDAVSLFYDGTATQNDYDSGYGPFIKAGETSAMVTAQIRGNTVPEADKSFVIRLIPADTNEDPNLGVTACTVTILNDDAALTVVQPVVPAGRQAKLTLDVGSPYLVPTTVTFTSSAPAIVPAPPPATIPQGYTKIDVFVTPRAAGLATIGATVPGRTTQPVTIVATGSVPSARKRAVR